MTFKPVAMTAFAVSLLATQSAMSEKLYEVGIKVSDVSVTFQRKTNAPSEPSTNLGIGNYGTVSLGQNKNFNFSTNDNYEEKEQLSVTVDDEANQLHFTSNTGSFENIAPTGEAAYIFSPNGNGQFSSHVDSDVLSTLPGNLVYTSNKAGVSVQSETNYPPSFSPMWYLDSGETIKFSALMQLNFKDINGQSAKYSLPSNFYTDPPRGINGYALRNLVGGSIAIGSGSVILDRIGVSYENYTILGSSQGQTISGELLKMYDEKNRTTLIDLSQIQPNSNGEYDYTVPMEVSYTNTSLVRITGSLGFSALSSSGFSLVPESSTWTLMSLGLAGVAVMAGRRRQTPRQAA